MLTALRQGRVSGLRITVACARSLDDVPYEVYLLDLSPADERSVGGGRFDEVPYLECLEPVLDAASGPPSWQVDVSRTHGSARDGVGQAHVSVLLAVGGARWDAGSEPDLSGVVRSAFARLAADGAATSGALDRAAALAGATAAVVHAFPEVDPGALSLTDEEHHAAEGRWSIGLALPGVARYQAQLGLVPDAPASAQVRRLAVGEVVDSVGT